MVARRDNLYELPKDLPAPQDDGACDHLTGMTLPPIGLPSTRGRVVDLSRLAGTTVVYIYPRTGRPDQEVPTGWNDIPGARGCTPQSCAFRDHYAELQRAGAAHVFGLSTQDSAYQREAAGRLHLPFELLSDAGLELAGALNLPTFEVDGMKLIKRVTLIAREGRIEKVFYPVFPPDRNAGDVLDWLTAVRDDELREISDED
ncbi:MAG TPA: peroxiredoxin [Burkholderiales bacterium]|nr:peroxiredoxin [Burkholderiales bacterium]